MKEKTSKGITLIALVITILILLIITGVTLWMLTGENGLLNKAVTSKEATERAELIEQIRLDMMNVMAGKTSGNLSDLRELTEDELKGVLTKYVDNPDTDIEYNENGEIISILTMRGRYRIAIADVLSSGTTSGETEEDTELNTESLIKRVASINESGEHQIEIEVNTGNNKEKVNYNINVINYNGNLTLDGTTQIDGATLSNNIYEFGDKTTDVATNENDAKNMVVLKVNGNLKINEGITLTACKSDQGYGGPKGILVYCTGTITNDGTISMTARGAKAEGENVYLWKNQNGSYEYVPAEGAVGGESKLAKVYEVLVGNDGTDGANRQTGGGGSGGAACGDESPFSYSGAGGNGTSYSGGTGGGGCNTNSYSLEIHAEDGAINGGSGGAGRGYRADSSWYSRRAGGGAGNPGGLGGENEMGNAEAGAGANGTGGLLIIYSETLNNNGKIESNGSQGTTYAEAGGGSSGGGSINIFYKTKFTPAGTIEASGGNASQYGSKGGDGSVSVGNVSTGTFEAVPYELSMENEIELLKIRNAEAVVGKNGQTLKTEHTFQIGNLSNITDIQWSVQDENVATVDQNGKVIPINSGETVITCKVKSNGMELVESCKVTVKTRLYLYFYGDQCTTETGGYTQCARTGKTFSATFNDSNIYINCYGSAGGGGVYTKNKIDLTNYKYLKAYGKTEAYAYSDSSGRLLATTSSSTWGSKYYPADYATFTGTMLNTSLTTMEHDISELNSEYYICNGFNQSRGYVYEVWLEE